MKRISTRKRLGWACLSLLCVSGAVLIFLPDSWKDFHDAALRSVLPGTTEGIATDAVDRRVERNLGLTALALGIGAWYSAKKALAPAEKAAAPAESPATSSSPVTQCETESRSFRLDYDAITKRRVGAALTDLALSSVLAGSLNLLMNGRLKSLLLGTTVCGLLQIVPCVKYRATAGMLITKIYVQMADGQPTTVFSILSFLGLLWIPLLLCLSEVVQLVTVGCIWYLAVVASVSELGNRGAHTYLTQTKVVAASEGSLANWRLAVAWIVAPTVLSFMVYLIMT